MSTAFGFRLCLDLAAASLLLFGLSYWWLGDGPHEAAGLGLFALVAVHNIFNRRWYRGAVRGRMDAGRWFGLAATGALALSMLVLVATSALVTTAVPAWLPPGADAMAKRLHGFAAYWAFAAVAVHLGLRWPMLMVLGRRALRLNPQAAWRRAALRLIAVAVEIQGIRSAASLGIADRLAMRMSLDWWDFDASVLPFFAHCAAVAGALAGASYYLIKLLQARAFHERQS